MKDLNFAQKLILICLLFGIIGATFSALLPEANAQTQPSSIKTKTIQDIPSQNASKTIGDLADGETTWANPATLWVDKEGQCWVNPTHPALSQKLTSLDGTPDGIRVTRSGDGYRVNISGSKHVWRKEACSGNYGWDGCAVVLSITNFDENSAELESKVTTKPTTRPVRP